MKDAYVKFTSQEMAEFVSSRIGLSGFTEIGHVKGRPIFLLK
jgi:hypothetical protein